MFLMLPPPLLSSLAARTSRSSELWSRNLDPLLIWPDDTAASAVVVLGLVEFDREKKRWGWKDILYKVCLEC
jgi:hypothetical protein